MPQGKNKLSLIFNNENFVAVNKPSGMLSIPDRARSQTSLKDLLVHEFGEIFPVHRLDKDTSGIILFAKNAEFHRYLSMLFESNKIEKYYTAIVAGRLAAEEGEIEAPIAEDPSRKGMMMIHRKGKPSKTGYRVIETPGPYSLVIFRLFTGRTHQIRVHASHLGCPVICDPLYGSASPVFLSKLKQHYKPSGKEEEKPILDRLALHASRLAFDDHGEERILEAPLPKEFNALLNQLRKENLPRV